MRPQRVPALPQSHDVRAARGPFGHGTPQFNRLNAEFRRRVFEEAAAADLDLVFTYVWALDDREELPGLRAWVAMFHGDVAFVELRSDLGTRLQRNRT